CKKEENSRDLALSDGIYISLEFLLSTKLEKLISFWHQKKCLTKQNHDQIQQINQIMTGQRGDECNGKEPIL
ncbi:hypothetical protein Ciccas_013691, partial [Cichlidogyrus casuarinus]